MSLAPSRGLTIVSGLPRSGTSMMMRMLEAGGMPVLTDGERVADEDNPAGYYEFESVKRTRRDRSWIEASDGKVVKMVYALLEDLPCDRPYRVLFMKRRLEEVHASQERMLERNGGEGASMPWRKFAATFTREVTRVQEWLAGQANFHTLNVDYNRMLADPVPQLVSIQAFLQVPLDLEAMRRVVDLDLYRQRST